jgi:hypothetical protein
MLISPHTNPTLTWQLGFAIRAFLAWRLKRASAIFYCRGEDDRLWFIIPIFLSIADNPPLFELTWSGVASEFATLAGAKIRVMRSATRPTPVSFDCFRCVLSRARTHSGLFDYYHHHAPFDLLCQLYLFAWMFVLLRLRLHDPTTPLSSIVTSSDIYFIIIYIYPLFPIRPATFNNTFLHFTLSPWLLLFYSSIFFTASIRPTDLFHPRQPLIVVVVVRFVYTYLVRIFIVCINQVPFIHSRFALRLFTSSRFPFPSYVDVFATLSFIHSSILDTARSWLVQNVCQCSS